MKKTLLIILFLIVFSFSARAADEYYYDGKWNLYTAKPLTIYYLDEKVNFDVPPMIIESRTLVPARILFEKMGADVVWNDIQRQVSIQTEDFQINLKIDSETCYVNGKKYSLDVPAKIVTDVNGIARTLVPLRFVSETLGYDVSWDEKDYMITINEKTDKPVIEDITEADYLIEGIDFYTSDNNDIIDIYTNNKSPAVFELSNPDRIVLDFIDTASTLGDGETGNVGRLYSNIRYAYHSEGYTRFVIDSGCKDYTVDYVDNCVRIILNGKTIDHLEYSSLDKIKITIPDAASAKLLSGKDNFYTFRLDKTFNDEEIIKACDTYIKRIHLYNNTLDITTTTPMEFNVAPKNGYIEIFAIRPRLTIKSDVKLNKKAKNVKVVIDPGHGGKDPGAVGKENNIPDIYEKDLNLDVSMMVQEILINSGYSPIMTRTTDTYVELSERVEIANQKEADFFVSIHNNAYTDSSIGGSQVYYYATENVQEGIFTGEILANYIQDELISKLGTTDRGVLNGKRYYVINNTDMPAVIVEGAFLTNSGDKEILKSYDGRVSMARAIANGIVKSLNYIAEN